MTWVTIICFAAALAWTAIAFLAYRDLDFAFRTGLLAWLICGGVWVTTRLNFADLFRRAKRSGKRKMLNRRRLGMGGVIVAASLGLLVLTVLTAQWLGKRNTEPASTKHESPASDQSKANTAGTQRAEGIWSVQVAAFRSEQEAIKLATVLKDRGWEAYVISADVNGVTLYRTNVGRFRTRAAAERLLLKLKDKEAHTTAFIVGM
jgi:hypothetical protein